VGYLELISLSQGIGSGDTCRTSRGFDFRAPRLPLKFGKMSAAYFEYDFCSHSSKMSMDGKDLGFGGG
jgi:hypothetical protein